MQDELTLVSDKTVFSTKPKQEKPTKTARSAFILNTQLPALPAPNSAISFEPSRCVT